MTGLERGPTWAPVRCAYYLIQPTLKVNLAVETVSRQIFLAILFKFSRTVTRGHQFKLRTKRSSNSVFLNCFCNGSVTIRNFLPEVTAACNSKVACSSKGGMQQ